jgi:AcrR family transcriptional regulator
MTGKQMNLLEAAEKLFAEKGYDGTSVRDIAQEAGVNLAMISYYFGSKDGLLRVLFEQRMSNVRLRIEDVAQRKDLTPMQKFEAVVDMYLDRLFSQSRFHKILSQETGVLETSGLRKLILEHKQRTLEVMRSLISQGVRAGEFRKGIDVPMLMMTLIGTTNHLITSRPYYCELNGLLGLSDEEIQTQLKKKLSTHLKTLFKSFLKHEVE